MNGLRHSMVKEFDGSSDICGGRMEMSLCSPETDGCFNRTLTSMRNTNIQGDSVSCAVEPPNKGHFESATFVLYLEAVLWWEVQIITVRTIIISIGAIAHVLYIEVVLWWEGPL